MLLLDLNLPKLDGVEALRRLHEDPRAADVAVVVLTSSLDPARRIDLLPLGVCWFLEKPLEFEMFLRAVEFVDGVVCGRTHPAPGLGE